MADFENSIDLLGDGVVVNSIIDRSITDFSDDTITSLRDYAFYGCANLQSVNIPNCVNVGNHAFNGSGLKKFTGTVGSKVGNYVFANCVNLTVADLSFVGYDPEFSNIYSFAFDGCTSLKVLILRCTEGVVGLSGNEFAGTPIASGEGYIYVPESLLADYKAAKNWSTYADQIRSIESLTFADAGWDEIAALAESGGAAEIFKLGDTRIANMTVDGTVYPMEMQIVGFNCDDLADGSGKAGITFVSKNLYPNYIAPGSSIWANSTIRTWMNETAFSGFPLELQSVIKEVTKHTATGDTTDKCWILSETEAGLATKSGDGTQYPYFTSNATRIKCEGTTTTVGRWWTRTQGSSNTLRTVYSDGGTFGETPVGTTSTKIKNAVCFCI